MHLPKFIFITLFLWGFAPFAQAQKIYVETDAKEVLVGQTFDVSYSLIGVPHRAFHQPKFDGFKVMGPQVGYTTRIVNGVRSKKTTISYTLMGDKPGKWIIPPATATVKGALIKSKSLSVEVVKPGQAGEMEDVFVDVVVLDTPAYPGSQVVLKYTLHTSINLVDISILQMDGFENFISSEIRVKEKSQYEVINGKQYLTKELKQIAIYPVADGNQNIRPLSIQVDIEKQNGRQSFMDQMFGSVSTIKRELSSPSVQIRTLPFPTPIPNNFSGAIGLLVMNAELDSGSITTDDVIGLRLKLVGFSNPENIKAPIIDLPNGLTAFPAKVLQDTSVTKDNRIAFVKLYEYLIQPEQVGDFSFDVKTSYFDPNSKTFKELVSQPFQIAVSQGTMVNDLDDNNDVVSFNFWMWAVVPLLLGIVGFFFWKKKKVPVVVDNKPVVETPKQIKPEKFNHRPALQTVKTTTKERKPFDIQPTLKGKQYLQRVLNDAEQFLGDKLEIPHGQFRKDDAFHRLAEKGNPPEKITALAKWWTMVETSIYANMPLSKPESNILAEIKDIVKSMKY